MLSGECAPVVNVNAFMYVLIRCRYAGAFVSGMQETDARGHPKVVANIFLLKPKSRPYSDSVHHQMLAFLKHFTAYSIETNRGHDSYVIDPCVLS